MVKSISEFLSNKETIRDAIYKLSRLKPSELDVWDKYSLGTDTL